MKKTNEQKGITLVALIITIVVLLILAIVAIGAVKDSKIIGHAQNAGDRYNIGKEKEQIGLAVSEWNIEKVIPGNNAVFKDVITNALQGQIEEIGPDQPADGPLTVTFNKTGNAYIVKDDGKIEGPVLPPAPEEDSIKLTPESLELAIGNNTTITATLTGSLKVEDINWTITQDGEKVTINTNEATCTVTGVSVGNATITAECGGKTAISSITVKEEQLSNLRAFDFSSFFSVIENSNINVVGVLSPDESEFAFFVEGEVLPEEIATEFNLSFFEDNEINIVIPENINYKKIMGSESFGIWFLISEDSQRVYYPNIAELSNGRFVFDENIYFEVDSNINASQYYQEDVYYYFPEYTKTIYTDTGGQHNQTHPEIIVSLANDKAYVPKANLVRSTVFVNKGTVSAGETIVVDVENGTVAIREGAQKLELNEGEQYFYAYIQDGKLYYSNRTGTPTRFINTGAFPTE